MTLKLSQTLLVALEHAFGDSEILSELQSALGGNLGPAHGYSIVTLDDDLVRRITASVESLEKRAWLPPYFGPLTAPEVRHEWRTAVDAAKAAA
jgi:hypothetical protein